MKLVSIYTTGPSEGRTTISTAMAKLLGQNHTVLVVELDYQRPTLALATGISNEAQNTLQYMRQLKEEGKVDVGSFVRKSQDNKEFSTNVNFLTFPLNYQPEYFPTFISENDEVMGTSIKDFSDTFVSYFKGLGYDVVLFIHPHQLDDLFSSPVLRKSDLILNVVTTNPTSLLKSRECYQLLGDIEDDGVRLSEKWKIIVNKYVDDIPLENLSDLLAQRILGTITLDSQKIANDLTKNISSERINTDLASVLNSLGFHVNVKRKSLFGIGSR